ncbi:MAG: hypothetical protein KC505_00605 [Myxococcales bacterium]|nr:hypothetical protein [Myxococcales bacterium]USN49838.1 MAG: hypothetical protein H6731_06045 [Myxococcales bacterium]
MKKTSLLLLFGFFTYPVLATDNEDDSSSGFFCPYELYGTTTNGPDGPSDLLGLNPDTGEGNLIATIFGSGIQRVTGIDFDKWGRLYGVGEDANDNSVLIRIQCRTGLATIIGPTNISPGQVVTDISFDSHSILWAHVDAGQGASSDQVGTIDLLSGAYTYVGDTLVNDSGNGLSFDSSDVLFHAGKLNLSTIDQSSGLALVFAPLQFSFPADTNPRVHAMDLRPSTGLIYGSLNDKAQGQNATPENYLSIVNKSGVVSFLTAPVVTAPENLSGISFNPRYRGCFP